jgi:hypothetical protein
VRDAEEGGIHIAAPTPSSKFPVLELEPEERVIKPNMWAPPVRDIEERGIHIPAPKPTSKFPVRELGLVENL